MFVAGDAFNELPAQFSSSTAFQRCAYGRWATDRGYHKRARSALRPWPLGPGCQLGGLLDRLLFPPR